MTDITITLPDTGPVGWEDRALAAQALADSQDNTDTIIMLYALATSCWLRAMTETAGHNRRERYHQHALAADAVVMALKKEPAQ